MSKFIYAQVVTTSYGESKISTKGYFGKKDKIDEKVLPQLDSATLIQESNKQGGPFHFAKSRNVDFSVKQHGTWEDLENGFSVWRLKITSKKALTVSVNFDRFYLTSDAIMYIYNGDGTMVTGPITSSENNPYQSWGSSIYLGESLIIEVKLSTLSKQKIELHIDNIAHGFKKMFDKTFGVSGICNINALCTLGNGWENERNSVALILNASSDEHCTGTLIRNTCNTNKPFFLTANHCYTSSRAGSVSNWKFIFQYWSPICSPNQDGSRTVLFNGSTLRANNATSDFALLELSQVPPSNSGITYAGWSRSTTAPTFTTGLHHPSGDVMKISRDVNPPIKAAYLGGTGNNHWQVDWDNGVTEGGSSGSALFDQNHRVVGQLQGGYSSCESSDLRDWYGAFDQSWNGGGTTATRLSDWLDPSNSGTVVINTDNVSNLTQSISGPSDLLCGSTNYSVTNLPAGATVNWSSSNSGIISISTSGVASITGNGTAIITANVTHIGGCISTASKLVNAGSATLITRYNISNNPPYYMVNFPSGSNSISISGPKGGYGVDVNTPGSGLQGVSFSWSLNGGTGYNNFSTFNNGHNCSFNMSGTGYSTVSLKLSASYGGCTLDLYPTFLSPPSGNMMSYSVAPNPASDNIKIRVEQQQNTLITNGKISSASKQIFKISLYSNNGRLIKAISYLGVSQATLDVSDMETGLYVLKINDGVVDETQQLLINR